MLKIKRKNKDDKYMFIINGKTKNGLYSSSTYMYLPPKIEKW